MEFTAQVTLIKPEGNEPTVTQTNTEKAKSLIFEALKLLAEDDPNILVEAGASLGEIEKEEEVS